MDFPGGSEGTDSTCKAGDPGLIPGSGKSPREGNGNPLQYSQLENPMDGGAGGYSLWGRKESDTTEPLSVHVFLHQQKAQRSQPKAEAPVWSVSAGMVSRLLSTVIEKRKKNSMIFTV